MMCAYNMESLARRTLDVKGVGVQGRRGRGHAAPGRELKKL